MAHLPIDKVLYALSQESGARPSIDLAARIPGTSRVERTRAKSGRKVTATVKGLALSAVVKERVSPREYHIRTRGKRDYIGLIKKLDSGCYGYRLQGAEKTIPGYKSQTAAIKAMLLRV